MIAKTPFVYAARGGVAYIPQAATWPASQVLVSRIPIRLAELYESRAHSELLIWIENRLEENILRADQFLTQTGDYQSKHLVGMKAITTFAITRNADKAIAVLNKSKIPKDAIGHYNMTFLNGFKGNLPSVSRHYNNTAK